MSAVEQLTPDVLTNNDEQSLTVVLPAGWSCKVVVADEGHALEHRGIEDPVGGGLLAGYSSLEAVPAQHPASELGEKRLQLLRLGVGRAELRG